jgi:hypothetical protein
MTLFITTAVKTSNPTWISVVQDKEGCYEHGKEPTGSVEDGEFIDQRSGCQFLRKAMLHGKG